MPHENDGCRQVKNVNKIPRKDNPSPKNNFDDFEAQRNQTVCSSFNFVVFLVKLSNVRAHIFH